MLIFKRAQTRAGFFFLKPTSITKIYFYTKIPCMLIIANNISMMTLLWSSKLDI